MGKQKNAQQDLDPAASATASVEVFVARQPIYNSAMAVIAYELLYRHSPRSTKAEISDPGLATLQVVTNAALEIGLERLAGGKAYVDLRRRADEHFESFRPTRIGV